MALASMLPIQVSQYMTLWMVMANLFLILTSMNAMCKLSLSLELGLTNAQKTQLSWPQFALM